MGDDAKRLVAIRCSISWSLYQQFTG